MQRQLGEVVGDVTDGHPLNLDRRDSGENRPRLKGSRNVSIHNRARLKKAFKALFVIEVEHFIKDILGRIRF
jgi:hypothetical protein